MLFSKLTHQKNSLSIGNDLGSENERNQQQKKKKKSKNIKTKTKTKCVTKNLD